MPRKKIVLIWLLSFFLSGSLLSAQTNINIVKANITIGEALNELEKQSGYSVGFDETKLDASKPISVSLENQPLDIALKEILSGSGCTYVIKNKHIIVSKQNEGKQQTTPKHVKGKVTDEKGEPVIGAVVIEDGTSNGTITDVDGNFNLPVINGKSLRITLVGYNPQVIPMGGNTTFSIVMKENDNVLEEVIVVGYNTVKKRDLTTSVASVSTDDIQERPIISAAQAIQGKAAGVQVVQPSGKPGAGLAVRVRGATSVTAANDPLYIIDGIPSGDINNLNPNDIENMQVLKDASSAAIYGARAANGVVLITTKRGAEGKMKVNFSSYYGTSKLGKKIQALNTEQYKDMMKDIAKYKGGKSPIPDSETRYTDWTDTYFGTGVNQNYQLSVSNGNEKLQYFVSAGYMAEKGIVEKANFRRYSFRANIDNKLTNWLKMGLNFSYANSGGRNVYESRSAFRAGSILAVVNTPPFMEIWDPKNPGQYDEQAYGGRISNPFASNAADQDYDTDRVVGAMNFIVDLYKGLKFKTNFGVDLTNSQNNFYLDPTTSADGRNTKGRIEEYKLRNFEWILENILSYDKQINKHNLSLLGGSIIQRAHASDNNVAGYDLPVGIRSLTYANQIDLGSVSSGESQWSLSSFIASVMYNYDSKYLFTSNVRVDGSSRFAPGHRWGVFPSFSAGWRMSSEEFMANTRDVISDLKLRAGWGLNGNQSGIGNYPYLGTYEVNRVPIDLTQEEPNLYPGVSTIPKRMANIDLTWEKTTQTNVGIDLSLFNSRILFTADAYYKHTKDLLFQINIPGSGRPNVLLRNGGEMTNKGIEFSLNSHNLNSQLKWNTEFNISFNKNKLTKTGITPVMYYAKTYTTNQSAIILKEGLELGTFYGFKSLGVDPETGDIVYKDLDGNGIINADDRTVIGSAQPKFIYGLTNTFSYMNFDLSVFIQGSYGNKIFNASRIDMESMRDYKNQSISVLDRWKRPGMETDIPRAGDIEQNIWNSDRFVEDGSYLRVKNITLSYNLKSQWLKKIQLSKLQPYITMQNLLTWTNYSGYDPEVNAYGDKAVELGVDYGTYPQSKTFIFGLNIEF